jgi:hypothetical protein
MAKERPPELAAAEATKPKAAVTYQVSETTQHQSPGGGICQAIAAGAIFGRRRLAAIASLEPAGHPRTPKEKRPIVKPGGKSKAERLAKKPREEELAKERRRAGRGGQKVPASDPGRGEKRRPGPGR